MTPVTSSPPRRATPNPTPSTPPVKPLRPRPVLFFVLLGVFAVWIALLLVLYFTTVHTVR